VNETYVTNRQTDKGNRHLRFLGDMTPVTGNWENKFELHLNLNLN